MKKLPSISIIARTYNPDLPMFRRVLTSVKSQQYPKSLIEYIVVDGGSTNGAIALAEKYGCTVIRKYTQFEEEARGSVGFTLAKRELVLDLEADNILTDKNWLRMMTRPFIENPKIFLTYSAYNTFEPTMPATTRYCALIGAPDPVLYYLGKSEKIPLTEKRYTKGQILSEHPGYYVVRYTGDTLPTLGANGAMMRRAILQKVNKNPSTFTHTDAISQLVSMGFDTFGVVKNSIVHVANPNISALLRRRVSVKK